MPIDPDEFDDDVEDDADTGTTAVDVLDPNADTGTSAEPAAAAALADALLPPAFALLKAEAEAEALADADADVDLEGRAFEAEVVPESGGDVPKSDVDTAVYAELAQLCCCRCCPCPCC